MSVWLIVNPKAGRNSGSSLGDKVYQRLQKGGLTIDVHAPDGESEFYDTLKSALAHSIEQIIVVGGDGTINLAINALMSALPDQDGDAEPDVNAANKIKLGIIPAGTGNDFIKATGIPEDWEKACDVIIQAKSRAIDVGRARVLKGSSITNDQPGDWRYFLNNTASGFDARVGITGDKMPLLSGNIVYVFALIYHLIKGSGDHRGTVHFADQDQSYSGPLALCAVSNGVAYGGAFHVAPQAKLDDGVFDVVAGEWRGRWQTLKLVARLLKGKHFESDAVHHWHSKHVTVEIDSPIPFVADGEIIDLEALKYEVELLPGSLQLFDKL